VQNRFGGRGAYGTGRCQVLRGCDAGHGMVAAGEGSGGASGLWASLRRPARPQLGKQTQTDGAADVDQVSETVSMMAWRRWVMSGLGGDRWGGGRSGEETGIRTPGTQAYRVAGILTRRTTMGR